MSLVIQNPAAIYPKNKDREALVKKAYENLGQKTKVTIQEYADLKGLKLEEAKEYDLNNDGHISLGEEASACCAKMLFGREISPTMVLCKVYQSLGFEETANKEMPQNRVLTPDRSNLDYIA